MTSGGGGTDGDREPGDGPYLADDVTVVTVNRGGGPSLRRAVLSVRRQVFPGPVTHLIVLDDDDPPEGLLDGLPPVPGRSVRLTVVRRPASERGAAGATRASIYPRLSRLFNIGARLASTTWLSYLDADNEYEPDHLASLLDHARGERAGAVHSGRSILFGDGTPYLRGVFPWAADEAAGRRIHALLTERGVWAGGNLLLDRVDAGAPTFRNSTVMTAADPTFLVDQSVWLLERRLVLRHPFPEQFTEQEISENTCPDDKFLEGLVRAGVRISSTGRPTVRYYLGGVSNSLGG